MFLASLSIVYRICKPILLITFINEPELYLFFGLLIMLANHYTSRGIRLSISTRIDPNLSISLGQLINTRIYISQPFIYLSTNLLLLVSTSSSIYLSIHDHMHLSTHQSISISISFSLSLSFALFLSLSFSLSPSSLSLSLSRFSLSLSLSIYIYIYILNCSSRARRDTRTIFELFITNWSFPSPGYRSKVKEFSQLNYLPTTEGRIVGIYIYIYIYTRLFTSVYQTISVWKVIWKDVVEKVSIETILNDL